MFTKIWYRLALASVISILLLFLGGLGIKTLLTGQFPNVARPEMTFQLRQYPEERHLWNCGAAIRVRPDIDRLRAYDLSRDDVMKAFGESTIFGSPRRGDPPPGVVFVRRLGTPDQYENVIVKASPDGEIVRIKDVAEVEVGWSMFDIAHWLIGIW
jgi:multidrug efflux pump subunit AcrB